MTKSAARYSGAVSSTGARHSIRPATPSEVASSPNCLRCPAVLSPPTRRSLAVRSLNNASARIATS